MAAVHRDTDFRSCGATTIASQSVFYVNGLAVAIEGDTDSHGAGGLIASETSLFIGGARVIVIGDQAVPDNLCDIQHTAHCDPYAVNGSPNFFIGR